MAGYVYTPKAKLAANYDIQIAGPFDVRTVVNTKADLLNGATFSFRWFKGMVVAVVNDETAENNGLYLLKDVASVKWVRLLEQGESSGGAGLKIEVLDARPEVGVEGVLYLVKNTDPEDENLYDEYLFENGEWERLGGISIDLSAYYTKVEVDGLIKDFVTISALNGALSEYVKAEDLAEYVKSSDLAIYAKTADLDAYAKKEDLDGLAKTSDLDAYAKAEDLAEYAKTEDLSEYAKNSDLEASVSEIINEKATSGEIVTSESVRTVVQDEIKNSDVVQNAVEDALAESDTISESVNIAVETALNSKDYATNSDLNTKADKSYVDEELGKKADASALDALATKDEVKAVEDAIPSLEGYAKTEDFSDVVRETAIADMATNASVDEKIEAVRKEIPEAFDDSHLATKEELAAVEEKIPSLEGYATNASVDEKIASVESKIPEVDTSKFATRDELAGLESQIPSMEGVVYASDIEDMATNSSVDTKIDLVRSEIPDTSNLATKDELAAIEAKIPEEFDPSALATKEELANKADKSYVDQKISEIEIPEAFDDSHLATKEELANAITEVESKIPEEFDDSHLATKQELSEVEAKIPEAVDTSKFATQDDLAEKADKGYVDESIAAIPIVDTTGFAKKSEVENTYATKKELSEALAGAEAGVTESRVITLIEENNKNYSTTEVVDSKITASVAGKANITYVDEAVAGKATESYVDTKVSEAIADKATESYVDNKVTEAVANKATTEYVDSKADELSSAIIEATTDMATNTSVDAKVSEAVANKATTEYVDEKVLDMATNSSVDGKISTLTEEITSHVDEAVANKATVSYVDSAVLEATKDFATDTEVATAIDEKIAPLATTEALNSGLNEKASLTYVNDQLSTKVSTDALNAALESKAEVTTVENMIETAVSTKAEASEVDAAYLKKEDAAETYLTAELAGTDYLKKNDAESTYFKAESISAYDTSEQVDAKITAATETMVTTDNIDASVNNVINTKIESGEMITTANITTEVEQVLASSESVTNAVQDAVDVALADSETIVNIVDESVTEAMNTKGVVTTNEGGKIDKELLDIYGSDGTISSDLLPPGIVTAAQWGEI